MINATAVSVVWNEGQRIAPLASTLGMWFSNVVIVVQKSTDDTLRIARKTLDSHPGATVVEDEWRGGGDFSMPLALSHVTTDWTFVISGDEFPSLDLLQSLLDAIAACEEGGYSGAFIRFHETIDGVEYFEHGQHVRLFRTSGGWEARHHSAASHDNLLPYAWPVGHIEHTRSLDEFYADYLRKLSMMEAEGNEQLALHNRYTIFSVSNLIAGAKGWRYVWGRPQWDEVERRVFAYAGTPMEII